MSEVSVVGLGMMGAALAKTLVENGREVAVWNRDPGKAGPLESAGARAAGSLAEAVSSSPVILVCVSDYSVTRELFAAADVAAVVAGRCIVQLSTGKPQEAVADGDWFESLGAGYLDGAILGSPAVIGTAEAQILVAGKASAWRRCRPVMECLAARLDYTGERIDSAAILDLAWLGQRLAAYFGAFQAILMCQAGGVGLDVYAATIAPDSRMRAIADTVDTQGYDRIVNSIRIWAEALEKVREQAALVGCNTELLDFFDDKFRRAEAAGYGELDMAALTRVLTSA